MTGTVHRPMELTRHPVELREYLNADTPLATSSSSMVDSSASAALSTCTLSIGVPSSSAFHRQRSSIGSKRKVRRALGQVVHRQVLVITRPLWIFDNQSVRVHIRTLSV
jgi:hypothetical protein